MGTTFPSGHVNIGAFPFLHVTLQRSFAQSTSATVDEKPKVAKTVFLHFPTVPFELPDDAWTEDAEEYDYNKGVHVWDIYNLPEGTPTIGETVKVSNKKSK